MPVTRFVFWIGITRSKYEDWVQRFGKVNEHNAWIPRDHWLTEEEIDRICQFAREHPTEGYRRLTYLMIDADEVACSPASVYRVLKKAGLLAGCTPNVTQKGKGFVQPIVPHEHWHVDVSYLNIAGTFYFLCSILDGCSRFMVHWEIREKMEEVDVETILQRAREKFPGATPRIITDNGPQFISKDFKEFIRVTGMSHVRTSPYYPQSNGKVERWHKTLKGECIRVQVPLSPEEARVIVDDYVTHYNEARLNSAIGYVTPKAKLLGQDTEIFAARDRKLAEARERRKQARQVQQEQKRSTSVPSRPALDFAAVRAAITIAQVLALLNFEARSSFNGQQRGACPLHGSPGTKGKKPRCFSVNTVSQTFHCFQCGRSGNALDLWAQATGQVVYEAAVDLCQRLGVALPVLGFQENREEEPVATVLSPCTMESP